MFGLQDANANHFIDPSVYKITVHNGQRNISSKTTNKIPIPIEPCSSEHLPDGDELRSYFMNLAGGASKLQNVYCIKKGYDDFFSIKGEWDQTYFHYIQIKIYSCANGTDVVCKDNQTIQNALKQGFFGFYSTDHLFDLNDYENPAKKYGLNYFIPTSLQVPKSITRYLKTNRVQSDSAWFFNQPDEKEFFSFDSNTESFTLLDTYTPGQKFAEMQIRKQYYESIYSRSYKKIKTLAAEISGFLNLIMIFLFWSSRPFVKSEYYDSITNHMFNFEVEQKKKTPKHTEMVNKALTLKGMIDSTQNEGPSPATKKEHQKLVNAVMQMGDSPIKISLLERLKSLFWKNSELETKKRQKEKGVRTIFSQLDIYFVLHKFMEIEKLKMLLLDENQRKLFEYLPKPKILKNLKIDMTYGSFEEGSRRGTIYDEEDVIERTKFVRKAYRSICSKAELTSIDQKLIEMLDINIKNLFHKEKAFDFSLEGFKKNIIPEISDGGGTKEREMESITVMPIDEGKIELNQVKIKNIQELKSKDHQLDFL